MVLLGLFLNDQNYIQLHSTTFNYIIYRLVICIKPDNRISHFAHDAK